MIRGFNSIPLDPTLLVRQSKCPKITYFNERRAQCKYHQFHNYKKILHFGNIKDILKRHDDIMEMVLSKINHNFKIGYYNEQHIFEYLKIDKYFNYEYYLSENIDLCRIQPSIYIKLGLLLMNSFPENFKHVDKEVYVHELIVQQNNMNENQTISMMYQGNTYIQHYFNSLLVEYDIVNEYIYCDLNYYIITHDSKIHKQDKTKYY